MLAGVVGACSSARGPVFERVEPAIAWPPAPETARVVYVGQLETNEDLKPAKSFGKSLGEALFGKDPALGMVSPLAVCTDGGSRAFVADPGLKAVHVFDLETRKYARWTVPEAQGHFSQPVALTYAGGRLFVSDSVEGAIFIFDGTGRFVGTFGDNTLDRPVGLVMDEARGRLYVADTGAHQVVVLAEDGEEVTRIGGRGPRLGEFNFPTNVALDAEGRLYVSDTLNFRVQVFSPAFEPLFQIGEKGDLPGYFAQPKGIALDPDGHVYVVDANFEAVQLFDGDGRLLMSFGREGRGPGEFWLPAGIWIDPKGRVWIADSYNRRVQVFEYLREAAGTPDGTEP